MPHLTDAYGRIHNYLRVSVTDRCNLRCIYCMKPETENQTRFHQQQLLQSAEILQVLKVAAELGMTRIRLTGGEPLIREDLISLIEQIRKIPGIEDLALTTNGILLSEKAQALRDAGLNRVNVSLDSLDPQVYAKITRGGDLNTVLRGIKTAIAVGLTPLKINVVFLKGINDREFPKFLEFARQNPVMVRLIEYMPIGAASLDHRGHFRSLASLPEITHLINQGILRDQKISTNGNAEIYTISGGLGSLALIRPISHHFCSLCNRLRLTADGFLKPCLSWPEELDLKPFLNDPVRLRNLFNKALILKHPKHRMDNERYSAGKRCMSDIGG